MSLLVCSECSTRYASGLECCPHCGGSERVEEGGGSPGSRLPFLDVACINPECPAAGVQRRMMLRCPVPGVVEVPASLRCARCGHEVWTSDQPGLMEEESMPKISRHGGASNAAAEREHPGMGVPMEGVEVPADGEALPPIEEEQPKPKRARRGSPKAKAADATATLTVTAEAQVTKPDGSVS